MVAVDVPKLPSMFVFDVPSHTNFDVAVLSTGFEISIFLKSVSRLISCGELLLVEAGFFDLKK